MEAEPQPHRIFYGSVIVAAAFTIVAMGMGLMFSLGVFMEPLETAFGWGRGQIAQGILYSWLMYGTFSLVFGALSDRFGMPRIVIAGGSCSAVACWLSVVCSTVAALSRPWTPGGRRHWRVPGATAWVHII